MNWSRRDFLGSAGLFAATTAIGQSVATKTSETAFPSPLIVGTFDPKGGHIQGACVSDDAIYLSQMTCIYKFDWTGNLLKRLPVISHTGDLCFYKGEIYTSVSVYHNARKCKGLIQVFDADLNFVREKELERGTDGVTILNGVLYLGMGSVGQVGSKPHRENLVGRFRPETLEEIDRKPIDCGMETCFGAQNITTDGKDLYFSFYPAKRGDPPLAIFHADLTFDRMISVKQSPNNGFDLLPKRLAAGHPRFLRVQTLMKYGENSLPHARIDFIERVGDKMRLLTPENTK
ncbi:MAG: hypothetical protein IKR48_06605 [Kiritimatiellae bacterium]|nr:hypothetical protein [Kiritimatiellia bacterium]